MDLCKTQFMEIDHGTHKSLQAFRRKSADLLLQDGKPLRFITWDDWVKLRDTWPEQVKSDKLTIRTVWTLVPVAL